MVKRRWHQPWPDPPEILKCHAANKDNGRKAASSVLHGSKLEVGAGEKHQEQVLLAGGEKGSEGGIE